MSASRETGTSGVDSCSEYQENVDLLGRFSSLSSETEDRAVFESTLLTEPIQVSVFNSSDPLNYSSSNPRKHAQKNLKSSFAQQPDNSSVFVEKPQKMFKSDSSDKINPFRSFPSLSSIHTPSPGSSKISPQPITSTRLTKTSTSRPKTSTPQNKTYFSPPKTSTPQNKTFTSLPKTSTPQLKTSTPQKKTFSPPPKTSTPQRLTLSVSSNILHPSIQKTFVPFKTNTVNNNKKRGRKLMFKKNVRSIKLINCQVTLKRIRREKYSEQLTTDQSEGNVESKRKQSKAPGRNYDENSEPEFPVPISPVLEAETTISPIPMHQLFCRFCEVRCINLEVHLQEIHVMLVDGKEVCGFCRTTGKPPIICLKAHMRRLYRIQCRQQSKPHQKRLRQCKSPKSRTNFAPKKCAKKQKTTSNKPPKEEYQDVIAFSDLMEISDLEDSFDSSGSQIDEIGLKLFSPLKFLEVVSDLDLRRADNI